MSDIKDLKNKFEHVVINVRKEGNEEFNTNSTRRISVNTLEWLSGKVETLRRKFSAAAHEQSEIEAFQKIKPVKKQENRRKMSESDGDLLEICQKYQIASANKYTWITEPFESIVLEYGDLLRANKIEIHRETVDADGNILEPPRGILLLPLSSATGQALLDFSEMGGFSLGRGSRVAKQASRALSRTHCMIYLENNCVYVKDCDSKTGTFVNGKLLGSSIPILLENFDIIQLGYGGNREDYIQAMAVFLDNWNTKEFAASIQQLNSAQMSFSRTFSSDSLRTFCAKSEYEPSDAGVAAKKSLQNSPLVSSPKMTQIKSIPMEKESIVFERPVELESIVFERPRPIASERSVTKKEAEIVQETFTRSPKMQEYAEAPRIQSSDFEPKVRDTRNIDTAKVLADALTETKPKPQAEDPMIVFTPSNIEVAPRQAVSAKADPYKVQYHTSGASTSTIPSTPLHQPQRSNYSQSARVATSYTAPLVDTTQQNELVSRPPIPRPRQLKKGLSKSAENLIEVEIDEIVQEVEKKTVASKIETAKNESKSSTVKLPLEAALSVRRPSVQQAILNVEIPEFLKAENLKIPAISPVQELLSSSKLMISCNQNMQRKIDLPTGKKRPERIEKMRRESAQFTTIVQGANTKRFETLVDFGSATSDISDGLAQSCQASKSGSLKSVFNNFRVTWNLESLNQNTGNKLIISASGKNSYELMVEGRRNGNNADDAKIKIGAVQMDLKNKLQMKVAFKIDDSTFKGITGKEVESETSLPLKALEQLSYFYPHLETPSILIQGPPSSPTDKVTISLVTSKKSSQIGRIVFESQKVSWTRRQMVYAVDLDTSQVEIDSLMADTIQSVALLYCLRYHID